MKIILSLTLIGGFLLLSCTKEPQTQTTTTDSIDTTVTMDSTMTTVSPVSSDTATTTNSMPANTTANRTDSVRNTR